MNKRWERMIDYEAEIEIGNVFSRDRDAGKHWERREEEKKGEGSLGESQRQRD